jgi:hypothetical protein
MAINGRGLIGIKGGGEVKEGGNDRLMRGNEGEASLQLDCAGLKAGERQTRPVTAGGHDWGVATPRLEVGGGPDGRAPPASDWREKERGGVHWADGRASGPLARARERRRPAAQGGLRAAERRKKKSGSGEVGRKGERGEGRERGFEFFFLNSFQIRFSNFNQTRNHAFES